MSRTYNQGIAMFKKIKKIEALKIGEKGKTQVSLYYKDLDGKIKPVEKNVITEKFLNDLQEKFKEKYGKTASKDNFIVIYVKKDILGNKLDFLQFLIDGEDLVSKNTEGVRIEIPVKKIKTIDLENEEYIKSLYISVNSTIETAHELKKIGGESIISS